MRITQGTFGCLPDLTDEEIEAQLGYAIANGWAVSVEHTDDPSPRNLFWEMWRLPLFDLEETSGVVDEIRRCREAFSSDYVKVNCFDSTKGRETVVLSFLVQRPPAEPGFRLDRQQAPGRTSRHLLHSYATERPRGERYR